MSGNDERPSDEHTVKRFDQELSNLSELVFRMGGLVEEQVTRAMEALRSEDADAARDVIARDHVVNFLEVQADEQAINLLALRQPMGRDLRMIMSLGRTVSDLERIGDEAEAIARMTVQIYHDAGATPSHKLLRDTHSMSRLALGMLRDALDSLARLDVDKALETAKHDAELDIEFQSGLRRLATYIMEDARNVGHAINATFILKSLERIGDHSRNIAEYVVYLVKGKDVRHVSPESIDRDVLGRS